MLLVVQKLDPMQAWMLAIYAYAYIHTYICMQSIIAIAIASTYSIYSAGRYSIANQLEWFC